MPSPPSGGAAQSASVAPPTRVPAHTGQAEHLRLPLSWASSCVAHVRLARPADTAFAFIGTVIGAGLAGLPASSMSVAYAVASSNGLLSAASMMFNDWHDVTEDAVNAPDRPIPSGAVPQRRALVMALCFFAVGIAVATRASRTLGLAALGIAVLSALYTQKLKSIPLLGNSTVGLLSAYPLWCWVAVEGSLGREHLGAAAAFFLAGVGREIIRTSGDSAGDAVRGIHTVAERWGGAFANRFGVALIVVALVVAWLSALGSHHWAYRGALVVATMVMLVAGGSHLRGGSAASRASRRLTFLARALTALLALSVAWDLIAGRGLRP